MSPEEPMAPFLDFAAEVHGLDFAHLSHPGAHPGDGYRQGHGHDTGSEPAAETDDDDDNVANQRRRRLPPVTSDDDDGGNGGGDGDDLAHDGNFDDNGDEVAGVAVAAEVAGVAAAAEAAAAEAAEGSRWVPPDHLHGWGFGGPAPGDFWPAPDAAAGPVDLSLDLGLGGIEWRRSARLSAVRAVLPLTGWCSW
jgi:hypothetical protein